jgi:hypothetical protein
VAYNVARNEYLIVYTYQPTDTNDPGDVYGKVSSASMGTLSGELHICDTGVSQLWYPTVAAGPDEYLVVWTNRYGAPNDDDIFARRVSGSGILQGASGGFPIAQGAGYQLSPAVAYGAGYGYLVTWHDVPTGWHTFGRYVLPGYDAAAGAGFEVSDSYGFDVGVEVACAPSGTCLMVTSPASPTDYEVLGRMVSPHRVYLPLTLKN